MESGGHYPLVAEVDGVAAGLTWAKADVADSAVVHLFQVWVAPENRGRGVAAALLHDAIQWAKARDARFVELGVTCGDTPAVRLYTRAGFKPVGPPEPLRPGSALLSQPMRLSIN
jgi:GNAT superfamily N-acetyltransferase